MSSSKIYLLFLCREMVLLGWEKLLLSFLLLLLLEQEQVFPLLGLGLLLLNKERILLICLLDQEQNLFVRALFILHLVQIVASPSP